MRDAQSRSSRQNIMDGRVVSSDVFRVAHHVSRRNTPIHNILSTAPQLSIASETLGTLPEDGNIMTKHLGATIHN
jgi:beta-lactamase superfamily II metal-dependent hydrolase